MSKGLTNSNDKALPFEPNLDAQASSHRSWYVRCFVCPQAYMGLHRAINVYADSFKIATQLVVLFLGRAYVVPAGQEDKFSIAIGACDEHASNLDKLVALTRDSKTINAAVVREAQNA
ncbi:MAG: hypothetical protein A3A80_02800 [Candidatus Terrybacteria bacterium RIFCSPLOWO2_01_FULL_44_24]|uniref:Uncharacterized protein n=1 Tax=Candidatus Terrybacteria bacterium RIFCSPHIGHO2_01_FULL_43_35 TaxID=1802361 RepID=A0A1G2PEI5_9BACT|nr:MAG: hypothetical protein A2828_02590 [Candidatus Terrybacteria bacterium RIFCSPHIGHO2_01_FULL_43_35]OHA50251.1 MAG: hypothetical protein A3B75_00410 [Candidatus Terrybacteria bacterium RIFCSPHIGHO2_02_FULL_43_14]OHA50998.1 MAG: hypothetical protein A3A80_02800 [Candidatus Terrybacteria bacterium RIFCSPLOWO2_01_FULL_44_24]